MKNQSKPLVSVVVITYNHGDYIRQCLNSIVTQLTTFEYEIIVGDDKSSDLTQEIINEFAINNKNIFPILRDKNIGAVPNFLDAISKCKGNFIAICEGDDYWISAYKLQKQVETLESNQDSDIVFCPSIADINSFEDYKILNMYGTNQKLFDVEDVIANRGGFMQTASIMFRSSVLQRIPEWLSKMDGLDYVLKVLGATGGAIYIPQIMSAYRMSSAGSWSEKTSKDNTYLIFGLKQIWKVSFLLEKHLQDLNVVRKFGFIRARISYISQVVRTNKLTFSEKINTIQDFGRNAQESYFSLLSNKYLSAMSFIFPIFNRLFTFNYRLKEITSRIKLCLKK